MVKSTESVGMDFFFNDTATTEIYTLSLHDALPISSLCSHAQASHCGGFSCCGAQALGAWASEVVARRLSSCGSRDLEHRLSSCGARA